MSAPAFLAELEAAGIRVTREDDNLRVRAEPGISLAPYLERITANKPVLLRELLERRIIEAVTVEPAHFDRPAYDALWVLWHAQDTKEESTP